MTINIVKIFGFLSISLILVACGQKGPLYLPEPTVEQLPPDKDEVEANEPTFKTQ